MIKKVLFTFAVVLWSAAMFAKPVAITDAQTIAINYYKHFANSGVSDFTIANQYVEKEGNLNLYYTFNFSAGGFVMVSADDAAMPVIGFSPDNQFDVNNVPENAQSFFNGYKKEISTIVSSNLSNSETRLSWDNIMNENFEKSANSVTPLCVTKWDQSSPYSNLVPSGTPTGCVATCMAQIMKKWNWPVTGTGSHSYQPLNAAYPVQTVNFGTTTYDWANMTNTYSGSSTAAAKTAVATLMKSTGVSVNMDYEPAGSGASGYSVGPALINYFNYQPSAQIKDRASFATDALWMALIKAELDAGRPVSMTGDNNGAAGSGHCWVCDGYNGSNLFDMNWGWSGSSNAYYALTNLHPNGTTDYFNSDRQAIIRITPYNALIPIADFSISNTIPAASAPVDFTDLSLNNPTSWLWTFDGGTPATSNLQNPTGITFATNGYHVVSLKAMNGSGSDIVTKERLLKVGGAPTVWIKQNSAFATASRGIDEIDILDANTVWAKAYDGTNPTGYIREFTKTNDGGTTWNPGTITFTNSTNYGVSNLFEFDYSTAYACMFPVSGTGGLIVKTTDGGTTWNTQPSAVFTNSWADFVHFFDANNGVCVGDPTATTGTKFFIYTTSDGGNTWTQIPSANSPNCLTSETGITNYYQAVGNTIWFTTTKGRVYKSTDMGVTWTAATTGFTNVFSLKMKDANVGIAVTDTTPLGYKKTSNGGLTWQSFTPTGYVVTTPKLAFVPGTTAMWVDVAAYPSNGSTYSTSDGATFMNIDSGSVAFTSVSFLDINTGWAGSFNASSTNDGIYKWNPSAINTTGINQNSSDGSISVYPIPSKGIINIGLGKVEDDNITITVYNILGSKVMSRQEKAISNDIIQLDLSDKDAGLYFISINNGGKIITKKIQIQK